MSTVRPLKALVSLHDVMPATLPQVEAILAHLRRRDISPVTLLVVPGLAWRDRDLDLLRRWQSQGCVLAGHGWLHHTPRIRNLRHWFHSRLISRNVAEHLALDEAGIEALMQRCHRWFVKHDLGTPSLYVPPAWAMGAIRNEFLTRLPFRYFETLRGAYDGTSGTFQRLPLLGFEADTALRAVILRLWNRRNLDAARRVGLLRVAIHPGDYNLHLADDLEMLFKMPLECHNYAVLAAGTAKQLQRHAA